MNDIETMRDALSEALASLLQEFNPYHDDAGRFTSKERNTTGRVATRAGTASTLPGGGWAKKTTFATSAQRKRQAKQGPGARTRAKGSRRLAQAGTKTGKQLTNMSVSQLIRRQRKLDPKSSTGRRVAKEIAKRKALLKVGKDSALPVVSKRARRAAATGKTRTANLKKLTRSARNKRDYSLSKAEGSLRKAPTEKSWAMRTHRTNVGKGALDRYAGAAATADQLAALSRAFGTKRRKRAA